MFKFKLFDRTDRDDGLDTRPRDPRQHAPRGDEELAAVHPGGAVAAPAPPRAHTPTKKRSSAPPKKHEIPFSTVEPSRLEQGKTSARREERRHAPAPHATAEAAEAALASEQRRLSSPHHSAAADNPLGTAEEANPACPRRSSPRTTTATADPTPDGAPVKYPLRRTVGSCKPTGQRRRPPTKKRASTHVREASQREQPGSGSSSDSGEEDSEEDSSDELPPSEYADYESTPRDTYGYRDGQEEVPEDDAEKENPHLAPWRRRARRAPFDHQHFIERKGEFTFGLLECFRCRERGCGYGCEALRCYYCHLARQCNYCINDSVEDDFFCKCYTAWLFAADCFLCCTLTSCCAYVWGPASACVLANVRYKTRQRYGIRGNCKDDCFVSVVCAPCVVAQHYGELYAHGVVPPLPSTVSHSRCCCCKYPYPLPQWRRVE